MKINNRICQIFGIKYPIFLAGMGEAACLLYTSDAADE